MRQRLLLMNIAGLGHACIGPNTPNIVKLAERGRGPIAVEPPTPALTSPSQATLLTGAPPSAHGIVANGWYFRDLALILNWQRSANLLQAETLWEAARTRLDDFTCANLFWRYATHSGCDVNVTERPTYWADGRKSPDFYTEPSELHEELLERLGPFPLFRFWGPAAGIESTRWIADASLHLMEQDRFDLILCYLPHLDYDHQRYGPDAPQGQAALRAVDEQAGRLIQAAEQRGIRVAIVSDYAFEPVEQPVYLNRALREAKLLQVQRAENGELLEPGASSAFAVCDQQIAHVYVQEEGELGKVRELLERLPGVQRVMDRQAMQAVGLEHERSGDLLAIAEAGCWFAYPYWLDDARAPDFAGCVAIHDKPGFDPAELFLGEGLGGKLHLAKRILQSKLGFRAPFNVISRDAAVVGGSHGRIPDGDRQRPVFVCDWPVDVEAALPMSEIRSVLLSLWGGAV